MLTQDVLETTAKANAQLFYYKFSPQNRGRQLKDADILFQILYSSVFIAAPSFQLLVFSYSDNTLQ